MLIGFPLDYWSLSYIHDAIKSFGRLLVWEKDINNLARIIIKVRVIDLELVPKSIQITDGDGFHSESWTVLCEIIFQSLLGAGPLGEDAPPADRGDSHPHPPQNWNHPLPEPGFGAPANGEADPEGPVGGTHNRRMINKTNISNKTKETGMPG